MDHNQSRWQPPPAHPVLESEHAVHIWLHAVSSTRPDAFDVLSASERDRASRFVRASARARYVAAHAMLRRVLGRYLRTDPATLQFSRTPAGKPFLDARHHSPLRFNLTHSADWAMLAVARDWEVGIDLEAHRPLPAATLAQRFFGPAEARALGALSGPAQLRCFFRLWTAKEALAKALGLGLAGTLDRFVLETETLRWRDRRGEFDCQAWSLHELPAPEGCSAALALQRPSAALRLFATV